MMEVVFERIYGGEEAEEYGLWEPTIPSFSYESGNAGIDLSAAENVRAVEVGHSPRLPRGYFEASGSGLSSEDISFVNSTLRSLNTDVMMNLNTDSLKIEYYKDSEEPLRMYEAVVRTGLRVKLPKDYHMRIASRSGLGFKRNILAFPGTIDNSYRGEIMIKLYQFTSDPEPFLINKGDRIAQGILFSVPKISIVEGEVDIDTHRGEKGFGSSGD